MKSTVHAEAFCAALKQTLAASLPKSSIPVLGNALAEFRGDACTLTCTNMEQWCQVTVPARGDPFSFCFTDTKRLLTAFQGREGELELEYTPDRPPACAPNKTDLDGQVTVRSGGRACQQRVICREDFPDMPRPKTEQTYTVHTGSLFRRFERIQYAANGSGSRAAETCVEFLDTRMAALNGCRLVVSQDSGEGALRVSQPFQVPVQAILDARALYPDSSLPDLFDETTLPPELRTAHQRNDRAVMQAYGFSIKMTESQCVAELMRLYQALAGKGG